MTAPMEAATAVENTAEAMAERVVTDVTRALEVLSVYLGVRLGLYQALVDAGIATAGEIAGRAGVAPRYATEWLEQQASAGYITCDDPASPAEQRRYRLPATQAEVFVDETSPCHAVPLTRMLAGVAGVLPQLLEAYRSGGGVPYADYGEDIRRGIAGVNAPMFHHEMTGWLAAMPDVEQRLHAAPAARVLDLGCGLGQSSIAIARAFRRVSVLGVDLDDASIAEARDAAATAGLADRVTFTTGDAVNLADTVNGERYELVTMFETLHDMGDPVGALRSARGVLGDGGSVLIADERVADELTTPADLMERFQFGWSVLHCLPATLAEDPVEANGTILRAPTLARWAREAGFTEVEVLPIENDFWRFYRLSG